MDQQDLRRVNSKDESRMKAGVIVGELPDTVHKSKHYFVSRNMYLDCRGYLAIDESAQFGYGVRILTYTHSYANNRKDWSMKPSGVSVVIEAGVFVAAFATLFNTKLGEGSVVSAGTVVLGRNVAPYTMVAGNPARVIARWVEDHWQYERQYFGRLE